MIKCNIMEACAFKLSLKLKFIIFSVCVLKKVRM